MYLEHAMEMFLFDDNSVFVYADFTGEEAVIPRSSSNTELR